MVVALAFWTFLLSAVFLTCRYGRSFERAFAVLILLSTGLTIAFNARFGRFEAQDIVLGIDVILLIVTLALVRLLDSYWPIWFAGFHAITVSTRIASLLFPSLLPGIYINAAGFWALPALLALVLGALLDHKMRNAASAPA